MSRMRDTLLQLVEWQRQWVKEHGGTLTGYVDRYHRLYGRPVEEAEAIYEADQGELKRLEHKLER